MLYQGLGRCSPWLLRIQGRVLTLHAFLQAAVGPGVDVWTFDRPTWKCAFVAWIRLPWALRLDLGPMATRAGQPGCVGLGWGRKGLHSKEVLCLVRQIGHESSEVPND